MEGETFSHKNMKNFIFIFSKRHLLNVVHFFLVNKNNKLDYFDEKSCFIFRLSKQTESLFLKESLKSQSFFYCIVFCKRCPSFIVYCQLDASIYVSLFAAISFYLGWHCSSFVLYIHFSKIRCQDELN
jgi:hypothetical protein